MFSGGNSRFSRRPNDLPHEDDPQFKAMEADMKQRSKQRLERHHQAVKMKDQGNAKMKEQDFTKAIELYEQGLEYQKGTVLATFVRRRKGTMLAGVSEGILLCALLSY